MSFGGAVGGVDGAVISSGVGGTGGGNGCVLLVLMVAAPFYIVDAKHPALQGVFSFARFSTVFVGCSHLLHWSSSGSFCSACMVELTL